MAYQNIVRCDYYREDVLSRKIDLRRVWEDDCVLSFRRLRPRAGIRVVVIPKKHVESLLDPMALDGALLSSMMRAIQEVAQELGLDETGFYVRANASAPGVTSHMH